MDGLPSAAANGQHQIVRKLLVSDVAVDYEWRAIRLTAHGALC